MSSPSKEDQDVYRASSSASLWMCSRQMLGYSWSFYSCFESDPLTPLLPCAGGMLIPAMCRHTGKEKTPIHE